MKRIFALFLLLAFSLSGLSLNYTISVKLNPNKKTIQGKEIIIWENNTESPAEIIPLHLYINAFQNNKTVFLSESGGKHRNYRLKGKDIDKYGYCKVLAVTVNGEDFSKNFKYLTEIKNPEKLNVFWPDETTKIRVKPDNTIGIIFLKQPVKKGEAVKIEINFETKFPHIFARTGYWKTFFMAGQWFPKIAVYQGERGWNCHLFHLNSEFFADFADYNVSITVPEKYIVGATGIKISEQTEGKKKTYKFKAENVIDFAWTAWNYWQVAYDKWNNVPLTLLYPPGLKHTVKRQFKALKAALNAYGDLTGHLYPYPHFTLVCPPPQAMGAGGMEYPMLVTGGFPSYKIPKGMRFPEMLIIHEFGHNYFYAIFATNEFENAWMDEGINSFATAYGIEKGYGMQIDLPFLKVPPYTMERLGFSQYKGKEAPSKASWEFISNGVYSTLSYAKPTIYLRTLENLVGEKKFKEIFNLYYNKFAFTHPTPEDFFSCVKEIAGEKYYNFIKQAITTGSRLDFAIYTAKSELEKPLSGYDFKFNPVKADKEKKENKKKETYINRVVVENRGDFKNLPVEVLVVLKNGEKKTFKWNGEGDWKAFEFKSKSPISYAFADPKKVYACDNNLANNIKSFTSKTNKAITKTSLALASAIQFFINILTLGI
ncbi:peptidase M1 [Thermotomaculum hydrothermale]|uniref:Peptidase M1 n=1 Tax=Thermotomaculum hydrothermale TaxID=981385 RepID=A0A7R6PIB5_9BACT|nr:M1 family metallopeptidase [Thermotomaculum hydrothermale]BBB33129.1 peptidase M1 [Thermotomaculum hydrothermale]